MKKLLVITVAFLVSSQTLQGATIKNGTGGNLKAQVKNNATGAVTNIDDGKSIKVKKGEVYTVTINGSTATLTINDDKKTYTVKIQNNADQEQWVEIK